MTIGFLLTETSGILLIYGVAVLQFIVDNLIQATKWRTLVLGLLLMAMTVATYQTIKAAEKNAKDADELRKEIRDIGTTTKGEAEKTEMRDQRIEELNSKLAPFIEEAKKSFPNTAVETALKKLLNEFRSVRKDLESEKKTVENLQKFSKVARLDITGRELSGTGGIQTYTEISRLMDPALVVQDNTRLPKCDSDSLKQFQKARQQFPNFPFSYYCLAVCLRGKNDQAWEAYAEHAIEIFRITTTFDGHQRGHDQALAELDSYMRQGD